MQRADPLGAMRRWRREWPAAAPECSIDVTENDSSYTVTAEMPGVNREDVSVSFDGNAVSISAEVKKEETKREGDRIVRSERYFGRVGRSFTLAHDVDADKAEARYADGVLTLKLPKKAGERAKRLAVK
ncbi:MAG: hypothetical protein RLZZ565_162 [Planctomycetota bacterium]